MKQIRTVYDWDFTNENPGFLYADRDATHPATYFDHNGLVNVVTTENIARRNYGWWDQSGFDPYRHVGILVESAATNCITYSSAFENAAWVKTNMTATDNEVL